MAYETITVRMNRSNSSIPWGFHVYGGNNHLPIRIATVCSKFSNCSFEKMPFCEVTVNKNFQKHLIIVVRSSSCIFAYHI